MSILLATSTLFVFRNINPNAMVAPGDVTLTLMFSLSFHPCVCNTGVFNSDTVFRTPSSLPPIINLRNSSFMCRSANPVASLPRPRVMKPKANPAASE
ncbi:hypothetical protein BC938DRAFT_483182 [Jimgerdemannia flammicorona]|uniref:Uncharacterized protein n=1 Tax=Jimgerdemannia flammicorona TaxID=994334 RepID=A0A433QVW6_9FUNG|nr:hypothetical protein BC938DRAFT_483182 [Jimgerdemannia flammicorona]